MNISRRALPRQHSKFSVKFYRKMLEKKIGNRILRVLKKGQEKMTVLGSIFAVAIQEGIMVAGLGKTLKVDDQFVLDLNG